MKYLHHIIYQGTIKVYLYECNNFPFCKIKETINKKIKTKKIYEIYETEEEIEEEIIDENEKDETKIKNLKKIKNFNTI